MTPESSHLTFVPFAPAKNGFSAFRHRDGMLNAAAARCTAMQNLPFRGYRDRYRLYVRYVTRRTAHDKHTTTHTERVEDETERRRRDGRPLHAITRLPSTVLLANKRKWRTTSTNEPHRSCRRRRRSYPSNHRSLCREDRIKLRARARGGDTHRHRRAPSGSSRSAATGLEPTHTLRARDAQSSATTNVRANKTKTELLRRASALRCRSTTDS